MPENFKRESEAENEDIKNIPGGIEGEGYVGEFFELQETIVLKAELTKKGGINDQHQIDQFVDTREGLSFNIDYTDPAKEREEEKRKRQSIVSFVLRCDENTGKPISEPLPLFIVKYSLSHWLMLGRRANQEGVPITDEMSPILQDRQYKNIFGQIWQQIVELERKGTSDDRKKIKPYKKMFAEDLRKKLKKEELEALGISAST
mgnify:FL=1